MGAAARARVFVNGQEVELPEPRGMFLRRRVDVTAALPAAQAATNVTLTVLVAPPDNVGNVDRGCVLHVRSAAEHLRCDRAWLAEYVGCLHRCCTVCGVDDKAAGFGWALLIQRRTQAESLAALQGCWLPMNSRSLWSDWCSMLLCGGNHCGHCITARTVRAACTEVRT